MDAPSTFVKLSLQTLPTPTHLGVLLLCDISTPSGATHQDSLVKIRRGSQRIYFRSSHKSLQGLDPSLTYLARTGIRGTVQRFETSSTLRTWPVGMSRLL